MPQHPPVARAATGPARSGAPCATAAARGWRRARAALVALAPLVAACDPPPRAETLGAPAAAPPAAARPVAAPGSAPVAAGATVVDSIVPIDEALRRFRADIPPVTALTGGAPSRDALVDAFLGAVARGDTAAIRRLALSRGEFAYLYYPSTRYTRKPYELAPSLLWFLSQQNGEKGITRVLRRYGGRPLEAAGYTCAAAAHREGENTLWVDCRVRSPRLADPAGVRLFGSIIERGGHFKFVSYANDL